MTRRIPIIDLTDLYHPHQDPGDNFDIIAPYAMPEIDLKAVILDISECFRRRREEREPEDYNLNNGDAGGRDAGFIPVLQCNSMFNGNVPAAVGPYRCMRSPDDDCRDVPAFEQLGIELLLDTLRRSTEPVDILVFCSCRVLAAAINREPALLRDKVRRLHLSIGTSSSEIFDVDFGNRRPVPPKPGSPGFLEWNVALDPHAFVRVLRSGLPMSLYPCAADGGPFALGRHNTYFDAGDMAWILGLDPRIRNYLGYAFTKSTRIDFLRALDGPCPPEVEAYFRSHNRHNVWETAIWTEVSGRKLVRRGDGSCRIVRPQDLRPDDREVPGRQVTCQLTRIDDSGRFAFELGRGDGTVTIFDRGEDTEGHAAASREALPHWYASFRT
jgi:hypothetical protein